MLQKLDCSNVLSWNLVLLFLLYHPLLLPHIVLWMRDLQQFRLKTLHFWLLLLASPVPQKLIDFIAASL